MKDGRALAAVTTAVDNLLHTPGLQLMHSQPVAVQSLIIATKVLQKDFCAGFDHESSDGLLDTESLVGCAIRSCFHFEEENVTTCSSRLRKNYAGRCHLVTLRGDSWIRLCTEGNISISIIVAHLTSIASPSSSSSSGSHCQVC